MEEQSQAVSSKEKTLVPVRCPKQGCQRVLFEVQERFLKGLAEKMICQNCAQAIIPSIVSMVEDDSSMLYVDSDCAKCNHRSSSPISGIRKYCRGCKAYSYIYFYLFLPLPDS